MIHYQLVPQTPSLFFNQFSDINIKERLLSRHNIPHCFRYPSSRFNIDMPCNAMRSFAIAIREQARAHTYVLTHARAHACVYLWAIYMQLVKTARDTPTQEKITKANVVVVVVAMERKQVPTSKESKRVRHACRRGIFNHRQWYRV